MSKPLLRCKSWFKTKGGRGASLLSNVKNMCMLKLKAKWWQKGFAMATYLAR